MMTYKYNHTFINLLAVKKIMFNIHLSLFHCYLWICVIKIKIIQKLIIKKKYYSAF